MSQALGLKDLIYEAFCALKLLKRQRFTVVYQLLPLQLTRPRQKLFTYFSKAKINNFSFIFHFHQKTNYNSFVQVSLQLIIVLVKVPQKFDAIKLRKENKNVLKNTSRRFKSFDFNVRMIQVLPAENRYVI